MKQSGGLFSRLYGLADLQDEAVPGVSLIEIMGDRRVLIEYHAGVVAYTQEEIKVLVSFGQISITGSGLQMRQMTKDRLIISGRIESVALVRR